MAILLELKKSRNRVHALYKCYSRLSYKEKQEFIDIMLKNYYYRF